MPRVKKPKIITITRPVFEIYENVFQMMEDPKPMFSKNDDYKGVDYLLQTENSLIQKSVMVHLNEDGTVKESEEKKLIDITWDDNFYGWVRSMKFETVEIIEEPKVKPIEEETTKKRRKK